MSSGEIIVAIAVAVIGSGSMSAIVTALIGRFGKNNPLKIGIRLILQDRIEWFGMKCIAEKEITYEQKRTLNAMHDCYHNGLHGNGDLNAIMEDVNELPVVYPNRKSKEGKSA